MILFNIYTLAGIIAWGGFRFWPLEGRVAYMVLFPLHFLVLSFITKLVTWKGPLLDNPWLWYGILLPIFGALACLGL